MCESNGKASCSLVVGLGNPGNRYQNNRHNLGFWVVEALARRWKLTFHRDHEKYEAATKDVDSSGGLVLLKPLTYMNLSGEALAAWAEVNDLDLDPAQILVICDDLALPLGNLRLRAKGSSGGQNGLGSVIEHLDSEDFARLRLGIDGTDEELDPAHWPDYVLADFPEDEMAEAKSMVDRAVQAVECWLEEGPQVAASRHNGPAKPPADS